MRRQIALAGERYEIVTTDWSSSDDESRCLDAVERYLEHLEAVDALRLHEALMNLSDGALDFELERIVMTAVSEFTAVGSVLELRPLTRLPQHA
jgi:hypothetical protein